MTGRVFPRTPGKWCSEFHCLNWDRYSCSQSVALGQFTQLQVLSCTQIGCILYAHAQRWMKGSKHHPVWFFLGKGWHLEQEACSTMPGGIALRQGAANRPCQAGQCFPAGSSSAAADGWGVSHQPSKASSCGALPEHLQEGSKSQEPLLCPDLLMGVIQREATASNLDSGFSLTLSLLWALSSCNWEIAIKKLLPRETGAWLPC